MFCGFVALLCLSRRHRAQLLSDSKPSHVCSAKAIYNSPVAVTYGHLGSPEELDSGEGTVQPLFTLSISFSMGWGGGFVPEAEDRARPPVIGWADDQTLTWLNRTMGEPLQARAGTRNAAGRFCAHRGGSAARGCAGKRAPINRRPPALAETGHAERNTLMASLITGRRSAEYQQNFPSSDLFPAGNGGTPLPPALAVLQCRQNADKCAVSCGEGERSDRSLPSFASEKRRAQMQSLPEFLNSSEPAALSVLLQRNAKMKGVCLRACTTLIPPSSSQHPSTQQTANLPI